MDRTEEFVVYANASSRNLIGNGRSPAKIMKDESESLTKLMEHTAIGLKSTSKLLEQLKKISTRKGIINDPSAEINQISKLFKEEINIIQKEIEDLFRSVEHGPIQFQIKKGSQHHRHCLLIVELLKKVLTDQMKAFQETLRQRTVILKEQSDRRKQYSHTRPVGFNVDTKSPLFNVGSIPNPTVSTFSTGIKCNNNEGKSSDHYSNTSTIDISLKGASVEQVSSRPEISSHIQGGSIRLRRRPGNDGYSNPTFIPPENSFWQVQELQSNTNNRLSDAKRVEKMIGDLGQMFSKFSSIVAQQGETVVHIEDDIEMAHEFASEGKMHLTRYYKTISGNRGIIIKTFILLAFFVWLFTGFL